MSEIITEAKPVTEVKAAKPITAINEKVLAIGKEILDVIIVDEKGKFEENNEIFYKVAEGQGFNKETIDGVAEVHRLFGAASAWAFGKKSTEFFVEDQADEKTAKTNIKFGLGGKSTFEMECTRHTANPLPSDRTKIVHSYGTLNARLNTQMDNKNAGYFGAVFQNLRADAAAALKDL